MGDCATDLEKTLMPLSTKGGIYDWSGTQASHVYAETGINVSKPEIDALVKGWWDGASDGWSSEKGNKTMATYAHSDYTLALACTNEDEGKAQGPAMVAVQSLMEAYKEAGY